MMDSRWLLEKEAEDLRTRVKALEKDLDATRQYAETFSPFTRRAADALADEVEVLVKTGVIDSRSPAGDALLDYRDPPSSDRADRLEQLQFNYDVLAGRLRDVRDRLLDEAQKSDCGKMMRAVAEKIDETLGEVK